MNSVQKILKTLFVAAGLVLVYIAWTKSLIAGNLIIISISALLVAYLFTSQEVMNYVTPKKVIYLVVYIGYLFFEIIRSNLDVAGRVIKKNIPLNPGIVKVKTKLKSKTGRMILANSITLTPGTLSVDVKDEYFYIHWIDVSAKDVDDASKKIVAGFEKYLEVIFG